MTAFVLVALVGGLGAGTRFVLDGVIRARWATALPVATIVINVSGSALIGALATGLAAGLLPHSLYLVLATGFCGGYTTFSTSLVETVRLALNADYRRALINGLGTLVLAVGAAAAGAGLVWLFVG